MLLLLDKNLLHIICEFLDDHDLLTLQLTCKDLYFGVNRDSFWMNRIIKRFQNLVPIEGIEDYKEKYIEAIKRIDRVELFGTRIPDDSSGPYMSFDLKIAQNNVKLDEALKDGKSFEKALKILKDEPVLLNPNIIFYSQKFADICEILRITRDRRLRISSRFGTIKLSRMNEVEISNFIFSCQDLDLSHVVFMIISGYIKEYDKSSVRLISKESILKGINKTAKEYSGYRSAEFILFLNLYLEMGGNINLVKTRNRGSMCSEYWNKQLFLIKSEFFESL